MSSASVSASLSVSDDCCQQLDCDPCAEWLRLACDYVTVTLNSCDVETEFNYARTNGVKLTAVNPQAGVHSADRIFEISMQENDVTVVAGGTITDEDGTEWIIYAIEDIPTFCLKRVWARSVVACFGLLGDIDVFEEDCRCDDDCGTNKKFKRVKVVKGNILAVSGVALARNDSNDLVYRFSCDLARWPLRELPGSKHRLKYSGRTYRISRVEDRGRFVPFHMDLEIDSESCC